MPAPARKGHSFRLVLVAPRGTGGGTGSTDEETIKNSRARRTREVYLSLASAEKQTKKLITSNPESQYRTMQTSA